MQSSGSSRNVGVRIVLVSLDPSTGKAAFVDAEELAGPDQLAALAGKLQGPLGQRRDDQLERFARGLARERIVAADDGAVGTRGGAGRDRRRVPVGGDHAGPAGSVRAQPLVPAERRHLGAGRAHRVEQGRPSGQLD